MLQTALRATLYGNKTRIDVARLQRLASGFSRFTVDGLPGSAATVPPQQVHNILLPVPTPELWRWISLAPAST
jgi:hypothetical protein